MTEGRETALGATWLGDATRFRVWAPDKTLVELVLEGSAGPAHIVPLDRGDDGFHEVEVAVGPGALYRFRVEGNGPFPDPASRFQPSGVHGPSEVIDPADHAWADQSWPGLSLERLVLYELHVGTFTPEGTFTAVGGKLAALRDLGVTAIELMPVADFAGERNWGYDGVAPFAPARVYGRPENLRRLVDLAHQAGLAVYLDVVYNHFGPDGAYQGVFSPHYFSATHESPWGAGINYDGPQSGPVRAYVVENAVRWVREYHLDGLRVDATHAIVDQGPRHIVAEIAAAVHRTASRLGRPVHVIAEDARNLDFIVRPEQEAGWGADGVWSDDFHHHVRRRLTGDRDGYFAPYEGSTAAIAATVRDGWWFQGRPVPGTDRVRGTDPAGIACARFVLCLQNHDQIGNRAFGDRLNHAIDLAVFRAAIALLLLAPETPLVFMGQEWAATTPFRFFTDHVSDLGRAVTEGRRREFSRFTVFADPVRRQTIPDPQALETFTASRLRWDERDRMPHQGILALHRRLLALRLADPAFRARLESGEPQAEAAGDSAVLLRRSVQDRVLLLVVRLEGSGSVEPDGVSAGQLDRERRWVPLLTTEDPEFAADPVPPAFDQQTGAIRFGRPGAVLLAAEPREES